MKKRFLSLAAALLVACSMSLSTVNAQKTVAPLSPEAQQDVEALLALVKSDSEKLPDQRKNLLKKYRKDKETLTAFGQFFHDLEFYEESMFYTQAVYERDPSFLPALLIEGDDYFRLERYGEAAQKFEEAIQAEPKDKRGYFGKVEVYKFVNPDYALDLMKEVKEQYPDDPSIEKVMGSIYYHLNDTAEAGATYRSYFSKIKPVDDPEAAEEYAIVLFINNDFEGSLKVVDEIVEKRPHVIALPRMKFYDLMELKKIPEAEEASKNLFGQFKDTLYNFRDYKYLGALEMALGNKDKAIAAYEKSVSMAPDKGETHKNLSKIYEEVGEYDKAAASYQKYIDIEKPGSTQETFTKGKIYYAAATDTLATPEQKQHYIEAGDEAFKYVADNADSYLGPFWRARIWATLDPENPNDQALEHYGETLKRLESKSEDYDPFRVECLRYMCFYYFKKDDYEKSKEFADKALALDADDYLCKAILNAISQLTK